MTNLVLTRAALGRETTVARSAALAVAGSLLIALCAKIQVPMWPVPVTMQTFAVLLIGLAYGSRLGTATVALYLAQGAVGLPVFAAGGGIAYLAGPTAGYLLGYLPAVALVGWLAERGWSRPAGTVFLAMLLGSAVIYLCGAGWLSVLVGPEKAVTLGVVPFLLGDVVKAALAAALLPVAWRLLSRF
ncbi:biotin transporter BioY [Lutibaculum baratangense]|nr:biotin transporter BioY [Lutibaculum baratangense]